MPTALLLRVVIDTNVVFEGLTKQGSAAGFVIDAWLAGLIQVHVSNALAHEYEDVLSRKLSDACWQELKPDFRYSVESFSIHNDLLFMATNFTRCRR
ncbi:PIN domain-containing protein [Gloeocapsopsis dulcis]|uniref:PIN domain-containing protein n=1 Tax=Gloeocapsopsis dulcis TaxID=2859516 RepID=UPI001F358A11|nr:PIN domain-containing protein [Gloeocapsopsis dulcis]WNN89304.1 PIN domain-containing protein [Gloeocapsopsis dulcis]